MRSVQALAAGMRKTTHGHTHTHAHTDSTIAYTTASSSAVNWPDRKPADGTYANLYGRWGRKATNTSSSSPWADALGICNVEQCIAAHTHNKLLPRVPFDDGPGPSVRFPFLSVCPHGFRVHTRLHTHNTHINSNIWAHTDLGNTFIYGCVFFSLPAAYTYAECLRTPLFW